MRFGIELEAEVRLLGRLVNCLRKSETMQLTVYRRDNRKRNASRWRQWIMVVCIFASLSALTFALYGWRGQLMAAGASARQFVLESPYFSVRKFKCVGEKFGGNEIVTMAGLKHGMNMWRIEPATIEKSRQTSMGAPRPRAPRISASGGHRNRRTNPQGDRGDGKTLLRGFRRSCF